MHLNCYKYKCNLYFKCFQYFHVSSFECISSNLAKQILQLKIEGEKVEGKGDRYREREREIDIESERER